MGNLIIVDGARDVGKSFLINKVQAFDRMIESKYRSYYKFKFSTFHDHMLGDSPKEGKQSKLILGTSFGKDIQILQLFQEGMLCNCTDIVMDRGFLSSVVFAVVYRRCSMPDAKKYLLYIQKSFYNSNLIPKTIYIESPIENPHDRGSKDKWDKVGNSSKGKQIKLYNEILNDPDLKKIADSVTIFKNEYDEESVDRFIKLIGDI